MKYRKSTKVIALLVVIFFLFVTFVGGIVPFLMSEEESQSDPTTVIDADITTDIVETTVTPSQVREVITIQSEEPLPPLDPVGNEPL